MSLVSDFAQKILREATATAYKNVGNCEVADDLVAEAIFRLLKVEPDLVARQFDESPVRKLLFK